MYTVNVVSSKTRNVVKTILCDSYRDARLVENGMNINLNHVEFYTEMYEVFL